MNSKWAAVTFRFVCCLLFAQIIVPRQARGDDESTAVRARIATVWRRLESLECHSIEKVEKQTDKYDSVTTIDFAWKSEGRSALSWTREMVDKTSYLDERDDGTRFLSCNFFATQPKAVRQVLIRPSRNRDKHYGGEVYSSVLMLFPGGETLADMLDEGATLANTGTQQVPRWTLKYKTEKSEIDCVLDESHGFLPKEMTVRTGPHRRVQRVDRFEQADGFWYPAEGATTFFWAGIDKIPARTINLTYRVDQIAFNRPIDPAKFTLSEYPAGANVVNQIENTSGYAGGQLARTRLIQEHPSPKQKVPTNDPIKVPADAGAGGRWWIEAVIIGIAVLAASLGVFFRWRGA